ncbi:hypothetical protein [Actinophytocola glycyrrhizae]|uniref:Uncharacterized protein n=1 Tax=Actinophytocola glycyrrhizae TaxID=2044873 RepID=A0ABV9S488_9PSEU
MTVNSNAAHGEHSGFRGRSDVEWGDPDFTVRVAGVDDLLRIQRENAAHDRSRRWSSEDALLRQVSAVAGVFLCPMLRNDGPSTEPESYRCWAWFVLGTEEGTQGVTLLDVGKDIFETLPELHSPTELRRVIKVTMARVMLGSRFENMW